MNNKEQAIEIIEKIKKSCPLEFFNHVDETVSGMRFVMLYLDANEGVYARELSEKMKISRARVAVLLKKLLAKQLIEKTICPHDCRKEIITLTAKGKKENCVIKSQIVDIITKLVDTLGIDKVNQFIELSHQIRRVTKDYLLIIK